MSVLINAFPDKTVIEDIPIDVFPNPQSLFERLTAEIQKPVQSFICYLNVHVANTAFWNAKLKSILKSSDVVYCDGAGIVLGAKLLKKPLFARLAAADWLLDLLKFMSERGFKVFLLGGEPGVADRALHIIQQKLPNHSVVGVHHGYILKDEALENQVIAQINALKPDLLLVGFGTPLQELWIDKHREHLNVSTLYAIGAVMDYLVGKVPRCPAWIGKMGLEWLFRFCVEPKRLFGRYILGNPWFLIRIMLTAITG
jgi:N-acetylglucosaminyldiphosphoundecaprenol N-acetyl-beta-D-mannosaminyltransferase